MLSSPKRYLCNIQCVSESGNCIFGPNYGYLTWSLKLPNVSKHTYWFSLQWTLPQLCSSQANDSSKKPLKLSFKIEVGDTHMYRFVLICGCWIANNENPFEVDKQWTNQREPCRNQTKGSLLSLRRSWTKNWRVGSQFIPLCFSAHLLVFSATADHIFMTWSSITQMWLPSS